MEVAAWEERRLKEQVRALRHLPAGTRLPDPPHQSDRDLLSGLLGAPDSTDPLQWLIDNHGDLTARALLWAVLSRPRLSLQGLRTARQAGQQISGTESQQFGRLLDLPEETAVLQELINTHPTTVTPGLLRSACRSFQSLWRDYSGLSVTEADDESLSLMESLFQLSETTDPLQWIRENHNRLAAFMTLSYLLGQIRFPDSLWSDEVKKTFHPKKHLQAGDFSVEFHEMSIQKASFTLTLRTSFSDRLLRIPEALLPGLRGIKWQGVEGVVDDLGNHYLVRSRLADVARRLPGRSSHSLRLLCYPAVVSEAKEITINSNETALLGVGIHPESHRWETLHYIRLGDLTWHLRIAK